jgi:Outer membrane protein beta-barrel domain
MKQTGIIILSILFLSEVYAQKFSVYVGGGMINYGGDLQSHVFTFDQSNSAFSAGVSYKLSNYFSLGASLLTGKLAASDAKTNQENYRRNLSFYTHITEENLTLQANLKNVPGEFKFTPYAFAGIGFFHFDPYAFDTFGNKVYLQPLRTEGEGLPEYPGRQPYKLTQFTIPFGGGITYAITDKILISGEVGFRKLFTDYLDDVSSLYYADTAILRREVGDLSAKMSFRSDETNNPLPFSDKLQRANPDKKDIYYTALIKLTFYFGSSGNSAAGWYSRKAKKQCGCPGKVL